MAGQRTTRTGTTRSGRSDRPTPRSAAAGATELRYAHQALIAARSSDDHLVRYASAHVVALRAAAAVIAAVPGTTAPTSRRRQRNAWVLLGERAPQLAEWAQFFAAGAAKRAAAEAGLSRAVSTREADDLLRDAETFCDLVEQTLGVPAPLVTSRVWVRAS